jgi:hypothetical protein
MEKHISLFERFVGEEGSNIYEAQEMALDAVKWEDTDLKRKQNACKTWINDYVIPMMGFNYNEKNPEFKTLISSAKSWLSKDSGVVGYMYNGKPLKFTNGEIVHILYWDRNFAKAEKSRFPLLSSMYDLVKGKPA